MHLHSSMHIAQLVAIEARMLTNSRMLVLAFQLWAITSTCVRAQLQQLLEPPYKISVGARTENSIPFSCTTLSSFPVDEWALYRNGVRQNTTDPCISPGKFSDDGVLTISSTCDGIFSCGAEYTNTDDQTGLVLSNALPVYGECLSLCLSFSDFITERAKLASPLDFYLLVCPFCKLLSCKVVLSNALRVYALRVYGECLGLCLQSSIKRYGSTS